MSQVTPNEQPSQILISGIIAAGSNESRRASRKDIWTFSVNPNHPICVYLIPLARGRSGECKYIVTAIYAANATNVSKGSKSRRTCQCNGNATNNQLTTIVYPIVVNATSSDTVVAVDVADAIGNCDDLETGHRCKHVTTEETTQRSITNKYAIYCTSATQSETRHLNPATLTSRKEVSCGVTPNSRCATYKPYNATCHAAHHNIFYVSSVCHIDNCCIAT